MLQGEDIFIFIYILALIHHRWKDNKTDWKEKAKSEWEKNRDVRQFTPSGDEIDNKYRYYNWDDLPDEYKNLLELREKMYLYSDNIPVFVLVICILIKIIRLFFLKI